MCPSLPRYPILDGEAASLLSVNLSIYVGVPSL